MSEKILKLFSTDIFSLIISGTKITLFLLKCAIFENKFLTDL